jgi:hypothetical protein
MTILKVHDRTDVRRSGFLQFGLNMWACSEIPGPCSMLHLCEDWTSRWGGARALIYIYIYIFYGARIESRVIAGYELCHQATSPGFIFLKLLSLLKASLVKVQDSSQLGEPRLVVKMGQPSEKLLDLLSPTGFWASMDSLVGRVHW